MNELIPPAVPTIPAITPAPARRASSGTEINEPTRSDMNRDLSRGPGRLSDSVAHPGHLHALEVEADVERPDRVGQRPDRDQVRTRLRVLGDVVQVDAAGRLNEHRPGGFAGVGTHEVRVRAPGRASVVAHDQARSRLEGLGHLLDAVALDLDHAARPRARAVRTPSVMERPKQYGTGPRSLASRPARQRPFRPAGPHGARGPRARARLPRPEALWRGWSPGGL